MTPTSTGPRSPGAPHRSPSPPSVEPCVDSTARLRELLLLLGWTPEGAEHVIDCRGRTITVCEHGHRAFLHDGQECPWCPVEAAGGLDVPQWSEDTGEALPAAWEPMTAEQVRALSWWRAS